MSNALEVATNAAIDAISATIAELDKVTPSHLSTPDLCKYATRRSALAEARSSLWKMLRTEEQVAKVAAARPRYPNVAAVEFLARSIYGQGETVTVDEGARLRMLRASGVRGSDTLATVVFEVLLADGTVRTAVAYRWEWNANVRAAEVAA